MYINNPQLTQSSLKIFYNSFIRELLMDQKPRYEQFTTRAATLPRLVWRDEENFIFFLVLQHCCVFPDDNHVVCRSYASWEQVTCFSTALATLYSIDRRKEAPYCSTESDSSSSAGPSTSALLLAQVNTHH